MKDNLKQELTGRRYCNQEAFTALKTEVSNEGIKKVCFLIIDAITIRKQIV